MTAAVYVATHPVLRAHRVGMTDGHAETDRLRVNERAGWQVVGLVHLATRAEARQVEASVLAELRVGGVPYGATAADMPQGGHTETVPADALSAVGLLRKVRRVAGQPEDGQGEGRLGAVLELLAWARRHVGPGAVESAWEADRAATEALLLRVVAEAEGLAAAARAEAEMPEGARALRVVERVAGQCRALDERMAALDAEMSPEVRELPEVQALLDQLAEGAEALARLASRP